MKHCRWMCLVLMWSLVNGSLLYAFDADSHGVEDRDRISFSLPRLAGEGRDGKLPLR